MEEKSKRDKAKRKFIEILRSSECDGNLSKASKLSGWSRQTIANWRELDTAFNNAINEIVLETREIIADEAEKTLLTLIREKNVTATIFALKTRRRKYYGDTEYNPNEENHPGAPKSEQQARLIAQLLGKSVKYIIPQTTSLSEEEKAQLIALTEKGMEGIDVS